MIGLVDPYCRLEGNANYFSSGRFSTVEWYEGPEVTYADVFNYLINTTSYCTFEQLRAYGSMEAFNFLVNGWVTNIVVVSSHVSRPKIFILMALVKHSQHLTGWLQRMTVKLCVHIAPVWLVWEKPALT